MKIVFISLSGLKFDVTTPNKEPLGGTESAICYLTKELSRKHDVTIMAEQDRGFIEGVRHVSKMFDLKSLTPDVIVLVSCPGAAYQARQAVPEAKIILWNHMRPDQDAIKPIFDPELRKFLDQIVYVSEDQKQSYAPIEGIVINNAIAPAFENMFRNENDLMEAKRCKGAYTSTPFRGLAILAYIQEIPIDIYSSMAVYQGDDEPYKLMYDNLKQNDCLKLHGSLSQPELAKRLRSAAFLTYPCTFKECHSIAILEAMAAGLKIITTDQASSLTKYVDSIVLAKGTVAQYAQMIRKNTNVYRAHPETWAKRMFEQVQYVNTEYTWVKRAKEWEGLLATTENMQAVS